MMEFDEIVVKESPGLCRCCLSEGCYKDLGSEYTWMNDTEVYADMLLECFDISITQHNEGPNGPNRLICEVCITRLRDACNFKKQVLDSEKKFVDMIGRGEFRPKMLIYQAQMKCEDAIVDGAADEAEVEYLEDDVDFVTDDTEELKEETGPSVSDITVSSLPVKGKRGRPRKNLVKTEKKAKVSKTEEKAKSSKAIAKGSEREPSKKSANFLRRRNLVVLFNNTTLIPFKWRGKYLCFYCGNDVDNYKQLQKHTDTHGDCSDRDRAIRLVKSADAETKIDVSDIMCKICLHSFNYFDDIVNHLISKHDLPYSRQADLMITPYRLLDLQCLNCDKKFDYFPKLVTHNNTSHPIDCFSCKECKQVFNKKRDLNTHERNYHRNSYPCNKCSDIFPTNVTLRFHRLRAHPSTCNICFHTFSSDIKRLKHMKSEHASDETQCGFCHQFLATKQAFLRHVSTCTAKTDSSLETIIVDDEEKKVATKDLRNSIAAIINMSTALPFKFFMSKFRCFYCPKDFQDCDSLKEHTLMHHPQCDVTDKSMKLRNRYDGNKIKIDIASLSCKLCFEPLADLDVLIDHLTSEHKVNCNKSVESILQPFQLIKNNYPCPLCGEVYRYFGLLLKHVSKSHTGNKYICVYCGQPFRTDPNLRAHVIRHHKTITNRYECHHCDLIFSTYNHLKEHLGKDHNVKMFNCLECSERFATKYWLQRHMLKVHGEGHKCSFCDKSFIKYSFMINHVRRLHFKEKNVKCKVCHERFFDRQRLNMHMVKHVGERNFHCDICSKKFLWKRNLRAHIASHVRNSNAQGEPRGGQKQQEPVKVCEDVFTELQSTSKATLSAKDKRKIMRNNVVQVLMKSTVMPFRWLKSSYRCFYCYDIFQEAVELKNHQQTHSGDLIKEQAMNNYWEPVVYVDISNLSCKLCPEKISDLYDLIDHLIAKHDVVYNKDVGICMVAFKLDNFTVSCLACGASFYTFGPLLHHTNKDHKGTSAILCEVCGQHFKDANLLRLHVKTVHENTGVLCPECGEKFETRSKLKTHQKNQHDLDKKYKCLVCSQMFQSHYKRSRHMAAEHKNRQEIKCLHCPKTFVFRSMMMTHLRDTHLKVRNHICGVCGWKAFNSNRLKNHMYKHSGEKNFKCDACDKAFTTKKIMRAHFARMHKSPQAPIMQYENPYVAQ